MERDLFTRDLGKVAVNGALRDLGGQALPGSSGMMTPIASLCAFSAVILRRTQGLEAPSMHYKVRGDSPHA